MGVRRAVLGSLVLAALSGCSSSPAADATDGSAPGPGKSTDSGTATTAVDAATPIDATKPDATSPAADSGAPAPTDAGTAPNGDGAVTDSGGAKPTGPTDAGAPAPASDASDAYKGVANSACGDLTRLGVSWYYNWETSPGTCTASAFIPMIWGHTGNEQSASGITTEFNGLVKAGYGTILGFNEPDNASQSNIDVDTALTLWPSFTANPNVLVGSPATQANTTGQAWFTTFMNAVNADKTGSLRVDFIAAHWYGWNAGSCDAKASTLESYVKWLEAIPGNRPIWLTEWGCLNASNPTAAVVQTFFEGAVAMFAKHPRVARYAWYPWTTNNELVDDAGLTPLGATFAGEPATH